MQDAARVHIDHDGRSDGAAARALLRGGKRRTRRRSYRKCEQKHKPCTRPRPTKTFELSELHPVPEGLFGLAPVLESSIAPKKHELSRNLLARLGSEEG